MLPVSTQLADRFAEATSTRLTPVRFNFDFRQIRFDCVCDDTGKGENAQLTAEARLAPIPYTAESVGAREAIIMVAHRARQELGGSVRVRHGHVEASLDQILPRPVTAVGLTSALVAFVNTLAPYLTLLNEIAGLYPVPVKSRRQR